MKRTTWFLLFLFFAACKNNPGNTKAEKIDYLLQEAFEDKEFIGSVLVADHGEVIYKESFGKSDQENNVENTDTTKFLIASVSKPITAILILRLANQGILRLDDTVNEYFTQADSQIGKITIHQLLTHTSGIDEIISKEEKMDISSLIENAKSKFEPGSDFEYSNSGYVLLKEIAQIATQKDYSELVRDEIFGPGHMTSSGAARRSTLTNFAKGYTDASQSDIAIIDFPIENVDGAGSLYSTVEDLYKLDRLLNGEELLSNEMKEQMLKQQVPEKYGYGWFIRERGGSWDVYWAQGNLPGFTSFISRRVLKDQFIVILSNAENAELSDLENGISRILKDQD